MEQPPAPAAEAVTLAEPGTTAEVVIPAEAVIPAETGTPETAPPADIGKYDGLCEQVLRMTEARTVILMIVDGHKGSGFSVCTLMPAEEVPAIPQVLREMANQIEAQLAAKTLVAEA